VGEELGSQADGHGLMRPSGPNAEEGQQAFGPEQRKENTSFSFFISNFPNTFSNMDLIRF
jgi:hypothetical protein